MPNRSTKDERVERLKAGPADSATRKRMLAEKLSEKDMGEYKAKAKPKPATPNPTKDLSVAGAAKNILNRKSRIEDAIDDASN